MPSLILNTLKVFRSKLAVERRQERGSWKGMELVG